MHNTTTRVKFPVVVHVHITIHVKYQYSCTSWLSIEWRGGGPEIPRKTHPHIFHINSGGKSVCGMWANTIIMNLLYTNEKLTHTKDRPAICCSGHGFMPTMKGCFLNAPDISRIKSLNTSYFDCFD
jgi:hypothetical protein